MKLAVFALLAVALAAHAAPTDSASSLSRPVNANEASSGPSEASHSKADNAASLGHRLQRRYYSDDESEQDNHRRGANSRPSTHTSGQSRQGGHGRQDEEEELTWTGYGDAQYPQHRDHPGQEMYKHIFNYELPYVPPGSAGHYGSSHRAPNPGPPAGSRYASPYGWNSRGDALPAPYHYSPPPSPDYSRPASLRPAVFDNDGRPVPLPHQHAAADSYSHSSAASGGAEPAPSEGRRKSKWNPFKKGSSSRNQRRSISDIYDDDQLD